MTLTLDEAIKEQERASGEGWFARRPELGAAVQLGIEAMKRVKANRKGPRVIVYKELPGETEEET